MARSNPSFLKRQKEQARKERAAEKRAIKHGEKPKPERENGEPAENLDVEGVPREGEAGQ